MGRLAKIMAAITRRVTAAEPGGELLYRVMFSRGLLSVTDLHPTKKSTKNTEVVFLGVFLTDFGYMKLKEKVLCVVAKLRAGGRSVADGGPLRNTTQ